MKLADQQLKEIMDNWSAVFTTTTTTTTTTEATTPTPSSSDQKWVHVSTQVKKYQPQFYEQGSSAVTHKNTPLADKNNKNKYQEQYYEQESDFLKVMRRVDEEIKNAKNYLYNAFGSSEDNTSTEDSTEEMTRYVPIPIDNGAVDYSSVQEVKVSPNVGSHAVAVSPSIASDPATGICLHYLFTLFVYIVCLHYL